MGKGGLWRTLPQVSRLFLGRRCSLQFRSFLLAPDAQLNEAQVRPLGMPHDWSTAGLTAKAGVSGASDRPQGACQRQTQRHDYCLSSSHSVFFCLIWPLKCLRCSHSTGATLLNQLYLSQLLMLRIGTCFATKQFISKNRFWVAISSSALEFPLSFILFASP